MKNLLSARHGKLSSAVAICCLLTSLGASAVDNAGSGKYKPHPDCAKIQGCSEEVRACNNLECLAKVRDKYSK